MGAAQPFFLVSGIHTPHFPWGDGEAFCDVLLMVGDSDQSRKKYAISARRLAGQIVDIDGGKLTYDGPILGIGSASTFHLTAYSGTTWTPIPI